MMETLQEEAKVLNGNHTKSVTAGDVYDKTCEEIKSRHFIYEPDKPGICIRYHVTDRENTYDMFSFPRGVLVIFNMREFERSSGIQDYPRLGSEKDANDLKDIFLNLGFVVHRYDNVSSDELLDAMNRLEDNFKSLSCFICVILSHGLQGEIYTRDNLLKLTDIFSVLETSNWVGKPKLFFIQACQGSKYMDALKPSSLDETDSRPPPMLTPLPRQSDYLYAYSTAAGYSSWRNTESGSWFIQELCESFRTYSHTLDLSRILTRANREIAARATSTGEEETNDKRQIASIINQLRKDVYFYPPNGPLDHVQMCTDV